MKKPFETLGSEANAIECKLIYEWFKKSARFRRDAWGMIGRLRAEVAKQELKNMIIKVKLDAMKIDKSKLFAGKNGAKYLDITLLENRDGTDQYGNSGMVVQDVSKEEREAGKKGAILGNFKIMEAKARPQGGGTSLKHTSPNEEIPSDDVPF